jgi:WhiB family redox-sensing transcriptional regulator
MIEASCTRHADVEFFPQHGRRAASAKVVCHSCPVQLQCLDYAIANEIHDGVWGGLSPQERSPIILRRRRARAAGA